MTGRSTTETLRNLDLSPDWTGRVEVQVERFTEPGRVMSRLERAAGPGWVCLTDEVLDLRELPAESDRYPLSAEWVETGADSPTSYSLRRAEDQWLLVQVRPVEQGGVPALAYDQELRAVENRAPARTMRYRVYWTRQARPGEPCADDPADTLSPWRPWLAAFRGWGRDEEDAR